MLLTEKRIAANRANSALSTGPKTPEGKARSSQNATRHGLLAAIVTIKPENKAAFESTVQSFVDRIKPADTVETDLVYQLAAASWRIRRALALESKMMDAAMDDRPVAPSDLDRAASAFGDLCKDPKLNLLHGYQHRLSTLQSRLLRDIVYLRSNFPSSDPPAPVAAPEPEPEPAAPPDPERVVPNEPTKPFPVIKTIPRIEPTEDPYDFPTCEPFDFEELK